MKMLRKLLSAILFVLLCICVFGGFTVPADPGEGLVVVYCNDGRILYLSADAAKDYSDSTDWSEDFLEVTCDIWNTAGDNRLIFKSKLPFYKAEGWSDDLRAVTVKMKNTDGKEKDVFKDKTEEYQQKGWTFVSAAKPAAKATGSFTDTTPSVALTFDDGPNPSTTNRLLTILERENVKATFFMLGNRAQSGADCIRRMQALGMELGSHTYDHTQLTKLGEAALADQIEKTNAAIMNAAGEAPTLMRPPYGSYNAAVKAAAGVPIVLWSLDSLDWKSRNADAVYQKVLAEVRDGSVILFHDIYDTSVDATERLIPALKDRGYEMVTVSELARRKGKTLSPGEVFSQG